MKIAAAAYPIDWHDTWDSYEDKLTRWVLDAAGQGLICWSFPNMARWNFPPFPGQRWLAV